MPDCPTELTGGGATGDWIQRGLAYAEWLRLCRAQLRNAPESTKGVVDQLLGNLQNSGQGGRWDQLVIATLKLEVQASPDDEHWQAYNTLILTSACTPAELLGIVLEMAREQQLALAFVGFKRLLTDQPRMNAQEQLYLCVELVTTSNTNHLMGVPIPAKMAGNGRRQCTSKWWGCWHWPLVSN